MKKWMERLKQWWRPEMTLVVFPEVTTVIAKDQPQYQPLPAYRFANDLEGKICCCWALNWRARLKVLVTGRLWHLVLTFHDPLQPQRLSTEKPAMPGRKRVELERVFLDGKGVGDAN